MFYVIFNPFSVLKAELAWLLAVQWSHNALGCVCRPIRGRASAWELSLGHTTSLASSQRSLIVANRFVPRASAFHEPGNQERRYLASCDRDSKLNFSYNNTFNIVFLI